jgi:hypothetical protein
MQTSPNHPHKDAKSLIYYVPRITGAARKALAVGDVTSVLKWVKPEAEPDITAAFKKTLAVRSKGKDAQELADRYFFETLVRIHRAGEGEPFTGLKDEPVEPIIAKTDSALAAGSIDEVVSLLSAALAEGIRKRFEQVLATARDKDKSVAQGRDYVEAYVEFTHYVERVHSDIEGASGHGAEPFEHQE